MSPSPSRFSGVAPTLRVQQILNGDAARDVERALSHLARSAALAIRDGKLSAVDVAFGDCSPSPVFDDEAIRRIADALRDVGIRRIDYAVFSTNLGTAAGQNRLLEKLDHPLVLIQDPTALAAPNTLRELVTRMDDPEIGIVEARQVPLEQPKDYDLVTGDTSWASSVCALTSDDVIKRVGGFDAGTLSDGGDDVDFSRRVRIAGYRVVYQSSAVVFWDRRLSCDGAPTASAFETRVMRSDGARALDAADVVVADDDQDPSSERPLFGPHTTIGALLDRIRSSAESTSSVEQHIRAHLPSPQPGIETPVHREGPKSPFLTVITRTQGRRIETLREVFLALAAQTSQDFEHIVIAHKVTADERLGVERLIEALTDAQQARTRFEPLDHGGRGTPLNLGFELARGRYVVALDDDDMVFGHWVETFAKLGAGEGDGRVLRTVAVDQDIVATPDGSAGAYRPVGGYVRTYPPDYDVLLHLERNFTPLMCLAFPRALYRDLGMRFDETLSICEDWDFEMRAVLLVGVAASPEITAIYRRWRIGESSATVASPAVWAADERAIAERLDQMIHVLPPGSIGRLREIMTRARAAEQRAAELETELDERRSYSVEDRVYKARKTGARWRRRALEFGRSLTARIKISIGRD